MELNDSAIGQLVEYFNNGRHIGRIDRLKVKGRKHKVVVGVYVKPIAGYKGRNPHCVLIPLSDIQIVNQKGEVINEH